MNCPRNSQRRPCSPRSDVATRKQPVLLQAELTEEVIGSFFVVYRHFGFGFKESVYKNALAIEFGFRRIEARREVPVEVFYRGLSAGTYRIDMLVDQSVIVEAK